MIIEYIGTGKTNEDAFKAARDGLQVKLGRTIPEDADVKVELISPAKKKTLGLFGGADAKAKASMDDGKKEQKPQQKKATADKKKSSAKKAPKSPAQQKSAPKKQNAPKQDKAKNAAKTPKEDKPQRTERPRKEYNDEPITEADIDMDYAVKYLQSMIDGLLVKDAKLNAKLVDGIVQMDVDCDDYGIIIGRRGETLDALQYLTSLAIKKQSDKYVRVTLNVGNYREKRVNTLCALAKKNASYVARTGKRYTFEPMNPYERRIIHTAIQEFDGVESRSIGYDQDRRVVLEPEGGVKSNSSYPKRSSGGRGQSPRQSAPVSSQPPKADRTDLPKFGKIEVKKED